MIGQGEKCPKCGAVIIVARPIATASSPDRKSGAFRPIMTVPRLRSYPAGAFGVAGVVLGAVACLTLWAPISFLPTAVIGAVGFVSAGLAYAASRHSRRSNIALPFVASAICGVAIYFSLFPGGEAVDGPELPNKVAGSAGAPGAKPAPLDPAALLPIGMAREWDDRALKVLAVKIDNVPLRSVTGNRRSQDKFLMVAVEASNTSALEDRKLIYLTLRGVPAVSDRTYASLSDSKGKFYGRISFGSDTYPAGGVDRSAPLAPGTSVRDILIFQRPTETAGPYRLELPLRNLSGVGVACWEIPESALR
jgi:hypothetical protein